MKRINLITFLPILLIACSIDTEKQHISIKNELQQFSAPSQIFTLHPDSAVVVTGDEGTTMTIRPHSFIKKDGSRPDSIITLELKEAYSKSEMIFNGLSTMSDGKLLESGGMIYINAMSGQDTLSLAKQMQVTMPNKSGIVDGQYFKGNMEGENINWTLNEYEVDTIITIKRIVTLSYGADSAIAEQVRVVGTDTISLLDMGISYFEDLSQMDTVVSDEAVPNSYSFRVNELGWINCDRFYDIPDPTHLRLRHNEDQYVLGYSIYENLSSISYIHFNKGIANIKPLPKGEPVTILAVAFQGDEYKMYNKRIITGEDTDLTIEFKTISLDKIKKVVDRLDK